MLSFTPPDPAATLNLDWSGQGGRAAIIYRCICDAVVGQRLPPGVKLTEEQLSATFGASRTLVRSALQALAHDHIVTIERHRGAFVSAPTVADAEDVFSSRRLVESGIARDVASLATDRDVAALRALLGAEDRALATDDRPAAIRLSGGLHLAIARIRGEGSLTRFLAGLISRSSLVIALYGRGVKSACGHGEHVALIDAIEARDGARAALLMTEHLDHIFSDLLLAPKPEPVVDVAAILASEIKMSSGKSPGAAAAPKARAAWRG